MTSNLQHSPDLKNDLSELLRRCVECGLCLPHCATFQATGNEVQSPRGRLLLLEDLLQNPESAPSEDYLQAFDHCIGCRACETACPGGVPYSLLEHGKNLADGRPEIGRAPTVPGFVLKRLDSPFLLGHLRRSGAAALAGLKLTMGESWRAKLNQGPASGLARLLGTMPACPSSDAQLISLLDRLCGNPVSRSTREAPPTSSGPKVVFFSGCANEGLMPEASRRLLDLLRAVGCAVTQVDGQECCGALAAHTARPGRAAQLRRQNTRRLKPHLGPDSVLLVEAAGCGLELKEKYGSEISSRAEDATVLLSRLDLGKLRPVPLKVVYHDPCHARHGQGILEEPRLLLRSIPGLTLLEPSEAEVCCGSGGAWGLHHPALSQEIGRRKAGHLAATGADLVLTSNPGCLGQIADGLALEAPHLPILPLTDLLWYAAGLPRS